MIKKYLLILFLVLLCFSAFGQTGEPEEIDYLLFMPDSADSFVNEEEAMIQLNRLSDYLKNRTLTAGQIFVYGYTAAVPNNIDPANLSRDRALYVINELQKRGVRREFFADPIGYGSVDIWGSNTIEANRSPNRRVRILLDNVIITPAVVAESAQAPVVETRPAAAPVVAPQPAPQPAGKFPWYLLLIPFLGLIAIFIILGAKRRKKPVYAVAQPPVPEPAPIPPVAPVPISVPRTSPPAAPIPPVIPVVPVVPIIPVPIITAAKVNLDEEIRFRAYMLYIDHGYQNGNEENDWYTAVGDICAKYEADGYKTYYEDGSWWAKK